MAKNHSIDQISLRLARYNGSDIPILGHSSVCFDWYAGGSDGFTFAQTVNAVSSLKYDTYQTIGHADYLQYSLKNKSNSYMSITSQEVSAATALVDEVNKALKETAEDYEQQYGYRDGVFCYIAIACCVFLIIILLRLYWLLPIWFQRYNRRQTCRMVQQLTTQFPNEIAELGDINYHDPVAIRDVINHVERQLAGR